MNIIPYRVNIVSREDNVREKDQRFIQLQDLIDSKKSMLINKRIKLNSLSKQNRFLETVKNDYDQFYGYIEKQKRDQIKALELLDEYIKELTISGKLTKYNIEDAKEEQHKILNEISSIKKKLHNVINDAQALASNK